MMDKIKQFAEGVLEGLLFVVAPLAFIAGYIYHLTNKNRQLEDELKAKEGESKLENLEEKQTAVDAAAVDPVADFEKLRQQYSDGQGSPGRGGEGDPSTESANSNQGSGTIPSTSNAKDADKAN